MKKAIFNKKIGYPRGIRRHKICVGYNKFHCKLSEKLFKEGALFWHKNIKKYDDQAKWWACQFHFSKKLTRKEHEIFAKTIFDWVGWNKKYFFEKQFFDIPAINTENDVYTIDWPNSYPSIILKKEIIEKLKSLPDFRWRSSCCGLYCSSFIHVEFYGEPYGNYHPCKPGDASAICFISKEEDCNYSSSFCNFKKITFSR